MSYIHSLPPREGPPYRSGTNGFITIQLFIEMAHKFAPDRLEFKPPFSLNIEKPGYICARTTWVAERDPTGYKWAIKYLGDYAHYKALTKSTWFREALEGWQEELQELLKSEALQKIMEIASGDTPSALVAAKYIAGREWENKRGRPSKAELKGELKRQTEILEQEDLDMERIGLKVIKGGKQ